MFLFSVSQHTGWTLAQAQLWPFCASEVNTYSRSRPTVPEIKILKRTFPCRSWAFLVYRCLPVCSVALISVNSTGASVFLRLVWRKVQLRTVNYPKHSMFSAEVSTQKVQRIVVLLVRRHPHAQFRLTWRGTPTLVFFFLSLVICWFFPLRMMKLKCEC